MIMCGAVERGLFESLDVENCVLTVEEIFKKKIYNICIFSRHLKTPLQVVCSGLTA